MNKQNNKFYAVGFDKTGRKLNRTCDHYRTADDAINASRSLGGGNAVVEMVACYSATIPQSPVKVWGNVPSWMRL